LRDVEMTPRAGDVTLVEAAEINVSPLNFQTPGTSQTNDAMPDTRIIE
jgi:hypothetical protein